MALQPLNQTLIFLGEDIMSYMGLKAMGNYVVFGHLVVPSSQDVCDSVVTFEAS